MRTDAVEEEEELVDSVCTVTLITAQTLFRELNRLEIRHGRHLCILKTRL